MKNKTILNNSYTATIFRPLLVTLLRRIENKWYLPVGSSQRRMETLSERNKKNLMNPSQPELHHFPKIHYFKHYFKSQ